VLLPIIHALAEAGAAMGASARNRDGASIPSVSATIPPIDPPIATFTVSMPSASRKRSALFAWSHVVTVAGSFSSGNVGMPRARGGHGKKRVSCSLFGKSGSDGPVVPWQPPSKLTDSRR